VFSPSRKGAEKTKQMNAGLENAGALRKIFKTDLNFVAPSRLGVNDNATLSRCVSPPLHERKTLTNQPVASR